MPSKKNPFPGMNPYLEDHWPDVHLALIADLRKAIGDGLPDDLFVTAEEAISVGDSDPSYRADLAVREESWKLGVPPVWTPDSDLPTRTVREPIIVLAPPTKQRWLEVQDRSGNVVTIIEVLSPTNKGAGWRQYRAKQQDYAAMPLSVVEIDLLRGGSWTVDVAPEWVTDYRASGKRIDYMVCVNRGGITDRRELYPCALREDLPVIRVPLRPKDRDVALDLQAAIDRVYEGGHYWKRDYHGEPQTPLSDEDRAWADERLRAAGLR